MIIQFLKRMVIALGIVVLPGMLFAPGGTEMAAAWVGISVNIGLPPLVFPAPPPVVVIPGTYVYAVPDIDVGLFFYPGYWYRPYGGAWYWASSYNGPWVVVDISRVPRVLVSLPPGSWRVPPGYHRIPHTEMRENWKRWEHERHKCRYPNDCQRRRPSASRNRVKLNVAATLYRKNSGLPRTYPVRE